jgi:hypothetical protein
MPYDAQQARRKAGKYDPFVGSAVVPNAPPLQRCEVIILVIFQRSCSKTAVVVPIRAPIRLCHSYCEMAAVAALPGPPYIRTEAHQPHSEHSADDVDVVDLQPERWSTSVPLRDVWKGKYRIRVVFLFVLVLGCTAHE